MLLFAAYAVLLSPKPGGTALVELDLAALPSLDRYILAWVFFDRQMS
jgi:hypothetical protein